MVACSTGWCYGLVVNHPGVLCCATGIKLALVSGIKQPVLIKGGRMALFLVVKKMKVFSLDSNKKIFPLSSLC